jgi:hypothetical protein
MPFVDNAVKPPIVRTKRKRKIPKMATSPRSIVMVFSP